MATPEFVIPAGCVLVVELKVPCTFTFPETLTSPSVDTPPVVDTSPASLSPNMTVDASEARIFRELAVPVTLMYFADPLVLFRAIGPEPTIPEAQFMVRVPLTVISPVCAHAPLPLLDVIPLIAYPVR